MSEKPKFNEDAVWKASQNLGEHFALVLFSSMPSLIEKAGLKLGSPIEEMMMASFLALHLIDPAVRINGYRGMYEPTDLGKRALIHAQRQFDNYRVDFAIEVTVGDAEHWIIVECDGHAYHERTPWQAGRDKARDRYFNLLGCTVLRFTGSEIHADVGGCMVEVADAINAAFRRMGA